MALNQDAEEIFAASEIVEVVDNDFNANEMSACLDDFDGLWEHVVGNEESFHASLHLGAAAGMPEHQHGFGCSCAFIEKGSVGQRHGGKVADDGLEVQQGFETAL